MKRFQAYWLVTMACLTSLTAAGAQDAKTSKPPNILFIYADDQSYKTVGCYPGSFPWVKTPNIDSLAAGGVRFTHAYLGAWCMPSRATVLTGRQPHGIESMRMEGVYPGGAYDPALCPFWPATFRQQGYHTAQIGKWHTGNDSGQGRDWDHQIVWNRPKHPENAGNYYEKQIVSFNGEERTVDGYSTDNYTDWACDYIGGQHRDPAKPWYLWLCYGAIHGPSHPAPRHVGSYAGAEVKPPADIFPPRTGKPAYLDKTQAWLRNAKGEAVTGKSGEKFGDESEKNPKTHAQWVRQVNECARAVDEGVGRVLAALKASGQLENTLVVYTSDQGFAMGEHGLRSKLAPYDASYRSPLIVSMPGRVAAGKVCKHAVGGVDLIPTFFAFAKQSVPWPMHGHDLSPLLKDPEGAAWPHPLLFEHTGDDFGSSVKKKISSGGALVHSNVPWWFAVREGKYKYVRTLVAGETEELYDLEADPEELTNLAGKAEHRELLKKLRATLLSELRRTGGDFADKLPPTRE